LEANQTEKLAFLKTFLAKSEAGLQGVKELEDVFDLLKSMGEDLSHVELDLMLARGLSYYTGAIFEVKVHHVSIGSVSGGGRYDNLTGGFGLPGVSGVGFSFGVDRLYDVLEELGLFPTQNHDSTQLLLAHFDSKGFEYALGLLSKLRAAGIQAEIYPDLTKVKKQLEYAAKKGIPFVGICGDQEIENKTIALKNLDSGVQESLSVEDLILQMG
jgi:histidyl-tRNA synthetase